MNESRPLQSRRKILADNFGLAVLAFSAPVIAFLIFSFYGVMRWGFYISVPFPIFPALGLCSVLAIPTLLVLIPFRKRQFDRWAMWTLCIIFWTWLGIYFGRP
jgi:hypothetical protein